MTSTLRTLLDRVEQGEGADREIDAAIGDYFEAPHKERNRYRRGHFIAGKPVLVRVERIFPSYTSSIDAAVALVEKVLPNEMPDAIHAAWSALGQQNHWHIALYREGQMRAFPRALLAATLRAKIAQEGEQ